MVDRKKSVVFASHWRPEVSDIASCVRSVARESDEARVVGGGRYPLPGTWPMRADVVVVSDAKPVPSGPLHTRWSGARVVRLWWNGADELLAYAAKNPVASAETHVCFFPEMASDLVDADLDVIAVPYAFSPPRSKQCPTENVIGYTGEVDVSNTCFLATHREPAAASLVGERIDAVACRVADGTLTMVDAATEMGALPGVTPTEHAVELWALRNRVRHNLMRQVVDAFGDRVRLRGTDWQRLGFVAEPSKFSRRLRTSEYQKHRISLDLGSKSTHAALYPRSVEIMAMAGGIVQFDTGAAFPPELSLLARRQARSGSALVAGVERLLDADEDVVLAENERLRAEYSAYSRAASGSLLHSMLARVS